MGSLCPRNENHCNSSQLPGPAIIPKDYLIFAYYVSVSAPVCSPHHLLHALARCWNEGIYLFMKLWSPGSISSHFSRCFVISPLTNVPRSQPDSRSELLVKFPCFSPNPFWKNFIRLISIQPLAKLLPTFLSEELLILEADFSPVSFCHFRGVSQQNLLIDLLYAEQTLQSLLGMGTWILSKLLG